MKRLLPFVLLASAMGSFPCAAQPALPLDDRQALIETLLERMTLAEKIGQLRLISIGGDMPRERIAEEIAAGRIGATFNSVTRADNRPMQDAALRSRLGVPIFFAYDVIHGHRTIFPISLALASSWDLEAIALSGRVSAIEASADGLDLTFAPMVDITRDPRWGRTSEGFGEDPYLVSQIAGTLVRAYQGERLSAADSVMASVKHFALYGAVEGGRDYNVVDMSPQRMHQDYLPPYRAAVDAGAGSVMIALNTVNGMPASANRWLLRDLLRDDWGFRGLNISDHGAIDELLRHGVARDGREAARLAIEAGIDLSMHDSLYLQELPGLVERGEVPIKLIDQAVGRVLGAKYDLGLFHDPYLRIGKAVDDPVEVNAQSRLHRQAARQVARDSLVLLENRQQTLPLRKDATIALVGPLADSHVDMLGSWSAAGVAAQTVTLRQGLEAAVGDSGRVIHTRGANVTDDPRLIEYLNFLNWDRPEVTQDPRPPQAMIDEAVRAAREADVIVAAVGESRGMSHESSSRTSLTLPASQQALLEALAATGKPLVVVLMNGRPLQLGWAREHADAVLETWFAGTEGGHAIAEVLLGAHNPSGKLPISFPRSVGQIPTYYNHPRLGRPYVEGRPGNYTSQYFEEPNGALYPFGYGLSYTEFELAKPQLSRHQLKRGQILEVSVTVKNTGARAGATVVQLYLQDLVGSSVRPIKELKRFEKLMLEPGESRVVRFELGEDDLKFPDARLDYVAEPGEFEVQLGLDSRSVQSARFELL
ncbi:beta-glucosidase BglX [Stutzerimonas kunmingensis]|uniref:beta-glucosidase BglX n=1 Tax=Stutzerimonas kunmingensis TaxID=1211807 RepID=UPI00241DA298|nr:beta-glucosidase BglX [Stutzerimonas kunmingensis]